MTSEQKLLQLIRKSVSAVKPVRPSVDPSNVDAASDPLKSERFWRLANRGLLAITVFVIGIVLVRYRSLINRYQSVPAPISRSSAPLVEVPVVAESVFERARPVFEARNIFQQPGVQDGSEEDADIISEDTAPPPVDLTQMYRIVGIALGENPTVIVESIQNASTLFLGVGDAIESGVIQQILEDKVLIDMNGQTIELR